MLHRSLPFHAALVPPLVLAAACGAPPDGGAREAAVGADEGDDQEAATRFESELVEGEPMYTVLPPDAIAALEDPAFVGARTAELFLRDDEPVLGVVGPDGGAKAYSLWQLDQHEIVNDEIDGKPIAATW